MIAHSTKKTADELATVVFKGYKNGLALLIPENGPFEKYLEQLHTQLQQAQDFFKGAKISVKVGKRKLDETQREALQELLHQSGLILFKVVGESSLNAQVNQNYRADESDDFIGTISVKRTVRSGQRIEFDGNLVIMGDVNPGAEVVASGDIIILGTLRGTAHAGAAGDKTAKIYAFQFNPTQIRIAGVITRGPAEKKKSESGFLGPEVAKIKDDLIEVKPALSN